MTCSAVKTLYVRCSGSKLGECVSGALTRRKFYRSRQSWRVCIVALAPHSRKRVYTVEVIIAFALLVVVVVYLRKAEPAAHAIVNNAAPGDGCALISALALGLPVLVVLAVLVALAGSI
jgi:hypothetical protein